MIARAIKDALGPTYKIEVATEGGKIYWVNGKSYPLPQNVLDWLARYARWRQMENLTFEVQYEPIPENDGKET